MYDQKAVLLNTNVKPASNFGLSFSLNAANLKFDVAFTPDATYTVSKVAFKVASITGSPTCTVRIEQDSAGRASGNLQWLNATATGVALAAGWTTEIALTASGTISPGTIYHLVIINDNGTPASNFFSVQDQNGLDGFNTSDLETFWTASFNGTTWSNRNGPIFMLSDGVSTRFGQPFDTGTSIQTMSSTTGYGVKFTCPLTGSVTGVQLSHLPNTGIGTVSAKIYDISDTLLGTATIDGAALSGALGNTRMTNFLTFASPVSLTASSVYRLVFFDSGSADRLEFATAPSTPTDYRTIYPAAQDVVWTQGSPGSWSPDAPGKLPANLMLMASSVTTGGSGGVLYYPSMSGGMVG